MVLTKILIRYTIIYINTHNQVKGIKSMYIDFHTHAFSDKIVKRAMDNLTSVSDFKPYTDGSLNGLKEKMKKNGVDISVVMPIATKPSQQEVINSWAAEINGKDGIYSFGSVHLDAPDAVEYLEKIKAMRLPGIKLHPDYQNFMADDEKAFPVYEKCEQLGLPILFHAGYDPLSPDLIHAPAAAFVKIHKAFPKLKIIAAHLGGMYRWNDVERLLAGISENIYFDTAFIAGEIGENLLMRIISKHGADRILLGSDCPWDDPSHEIEMIENLPISSEDKDKIFYKNAKQLLGIC